MDAISELARNARLASVELAWLSTEVKNECLLELADRIDAEKDRIIQANEQDLTEARDAGITPAKLRRLTLSDASVQQMSDGLRQVVALPDPVGVVTKRCTVPSGLKVSKVRAPLGVIMMIYEARPNVTIDAFALCFKAGNACILKGGKEAAHSNQLLGDLVVSALEAKGVAGQAFNLLATSDREVVKHLLSLEEYIDLVIPRGGSELIQFVHRHSRIPTVQHFHGVCHIFVDASADLDQAEQICATAKTSAPATCNAVECILVHEAIAADFVPRLVQRYRKDGVEIRGDSQVVALAPDALAAEPQDFGKEFLDLIVAMKVVPDIESAIEHINTLGSQHTDAILSTDPQNQQRFLDRVQSSCTLVNASTRFNDGFQLGLGAEIGISTSRVHAFGPMGLEELTTQRYQVYGDGHAR